MRGGGRGWREGGSELWSSKIYWRCVGLGVVGVGSGPIEMSWGGGGVVYIQTHALQTRLVVLCWEAVARLKMHSKTTTLFLAHLTKI